jgi:hypothetical protein
VVSALRAVGLTLAEIQELAGSYLRPQGENIGPRLTGMLGVARARTQDRIRAGLRGRLVPGARH